MNNDCPVAKYTNREVACDSQDPRKSSDICLQSQRKTKEYLYDNVKKCVLGLFKGNAFKLSAILCL